MCESEDGWASRDVFHRGAHGQLIGGWRGRKSRLGRATHSVGGASSQSGLEGRERSSQFRFFSCSTDGSCAKKNQKGVLVPAAAAAAGFFRPERGKGAGGRPVPAYSGSLRLARRLIKAGRGVASPPRWSARSGKQRRLSGRPSGNCFSASVGRFVLILLLKKKHRDRPRCAVGFQAQAG